MVRFTLDRAGETSCSRGPAQRLVDPRLARALVAVHGEPQQAWTPEHLDATASMSRTTFATRFRAVVDQNPGDYLYRLHMALSKDREN